MNSHDQKQFLELLQVYKSEDTKKARRNLSVIGFVIVAMRLLGIQITEIRVFGADLSKTSELYSLLLALVLIVYWAVIFLLSWVHDSEIQKERKILVDAEIDQIMTSWKRFEKLKLEMEAKNEGGNPRGYNEAKAAVEMYHRQCQRTARADKYGRIIRALELFVPLGIALTAIGIISNGIWFSLQEQ